MRILHCITNLDPALGGSVEACRLLVNGMAGAGANVEVASLVAVQPDWRSEWKAPVHSIGEASGLYRYTRRLVPWLRENGRRYHAAIVHGMWRYTGPGTRKALRGRTPYYVFPHGMMDPWFQKAHPFKHVQKRVAWFLAERQVLRDARAVLFTAEDERLLANRSFPGYSCREEVAGLGVEDPLASGEAPQQRAERFLARHPRLRGKRILLFLGRLHKKKGVDLLVEACLRLFPSHPELHLVVAGTEDSSVNRQHLEARIAAAALQEQVTWTGPVYGAEKWETYCAASLFVLPSHSENFGLTIAEALACSVPILTTFRVNIWRELKEQGVGIIVDDTAQGTAEGIREFLASYPQPSPQLAVRARQTFQAAYDAGAAGRRLLAFLREDLANAGEARETAYA